MSSRERAGAMAVTTGFADGGWPDLGREADLSRVWREEGVLTVEAVPKFWSNEDR